MVNEKGGGEGDGERGIVPLYLNPPHKTIPPKLKKGKRGGYLFGRFYLAARFDDTRTEFRD